MTTSTRTPARIRTWNPIELAHALVPVTPVVIGAALALVSSVPLPRGPVTGGQALLCIGTSLLAGLAAGRMSRSNWSILLAPLG